MMRPYVGSWKRLAVHGVAAILFGLATLVWPDVSLWALVVLWGAFAFVDGVTALSAAIADPLLRDRGWAAFWGVTGIAAGVVTFVWPSITAQALLVVIATWSLLIGGSQIVFAVKARKQVSDAWAIALGGALLVLLGRAARHRPRCRGARHHVGDRVVRLPVRHRAALACVGRPPRDARADAGRHASKRHSPDTRWADITHAAAATHPHAAHPTPPAMRAGGVARGGAVPPSSESARRTRTGTRRGRVAPPPS